MAKGNPEIGDENPPKQTNSDGKLQLNKHRLIKTILDSNNTDKIIINIKPPGLTKPNRFSLFHLLTKLSRGFNGRFKPRIGITDDGQQLV